MPSYIPEITEEQFLNACEILRQEACVSIHFEHPGFGEPLEFDRKGAVAFVPYFVGVLNRVLAGEE